MMAANFPGHTHATHMGVNTRWLALVVTLVTSPSSRFHCSSNVHARLQARTSLLASSLAEANKDSPSSRCTIRSPTAEPYSAGRSSRSGDRKPIVKEAALH
ncbi:hypothetical protein [Cronobacter sakazakii]|uniref:hypothetical protein n=1 Tax=Cronobacter sakazakii TaxID=28141 RepID=UPI00351819CC